MKTTHLLTLTVDLKTVSGGTTANKDGSRRRLTGHRKKYLERMFVNGKYIPKSHPLWKAGRYRSLDDAWSHNKIESIDQGEVYIIVNDAWQDWVKVGKAVSSE